MFLLIIKSVMIIHLFPIIESIIIKSVAHNSHIENSDYHLTLKARAQANDMSLL